MIKNLFLSITVILATFFLLSSSVYSDVETEISLSFNPETNSLTVTTDATTEKELSYHLYYTNEEKIELVQGKLEGEITEIELKTCSGEDCTDHDVTKGVLKIEATENVKTRYFVISDETLNSRLGKPSSFLDLTEKEKAWLDSESFSFPVTQLPAIVPFSPMPTISFLPNISIQPVNESFSVFNSENIIPPASLLSFPEGTKFTGAKGFQKISASEGFFTAPLDSGDVFGTTVRNIGDLDGDSITDIAVAAVWDDDGGTLRGAIYILFLKADGTVKKHQKISDTEGNFLAPLDNSDTLGYGITNMGDLDGDSITDIAVGAIGDDDGGQDRGAVYILFLNDDGTVKDYQKISDTEGNLGPPFNLTDDDHFGRSLKVIGDLDNDSVPELAVGAPGDPNKGALYILFLNADGTVKNHYKLSNTLGNFPPHANNRLGFSVGGIGDLDGDNINDMATGMSSTTNEGSVYILFLNADGSIKNHQIIDSDEGNFSATLDDHDSFGFEISQVGDFNGDNITDIAVGAFRDDDGGG